MRPSYQELARNYPRSETREELYAALGWNDIVNHPAYKDTCAIRMSYELVLAKVILPGAPMRVKAGDAAGRFLEHRQATLSQTLKRMWGNPEVYTNDQAARRAIGSRNGVVSFFKISGGNGGHIDLVGLDKHGFLDCARTCYFTAKTTWFWPLP